MLKLLEKVLAFETIIALILVFLLLFIKFAGDINAIATTNTQATIMVASVSQFENLDFSTKKTDETMQALTDISPIGSVNLTEEARSEEDRWNAMYGEAEATSVATIDTTSTEGAAQKPEQIYKSICFACHDTGAAGAPILGNKEAWEARFNQGFATLVDHAINGYNAMPARGGNPSLTDEEMRDTIVYMLEKTGFTIEAEELAAAE